MANDITPDEAQSGEPDEYYVPKFRAVTTQSGRHGLKLESIFWRVLEMIGRESSKQTSQIVEECEALDLANKNLSSRIRVYATSRMLRLTENLRTCMDERAWRGIVYAAPVPAFVLSKQRRIICFNEYFLDFVAKNLSSSFTAANLSKLKMVLDMPIEKVIDELIVNDNQPVKIGIALGMDDRRTRHTIAAVFSPSETLENILCFILPQ